MLRRPARINPFKKKFIPKSQLMDEERKKTPIRQQVRDILDFKEKNPEARFYLIMKKKNLSFHGSYGKTYFNPIKTIKPSEVEQEVQNIISGKYGVGSFNFQPYLTNHLGKFSQPIQFLDD